MSKSSAASAASPTAVGPRSSRGDVISTKKVDATVTDSAVGRRGSDTNGVDSIPSKTHAATASFSANNAIALNEFGGVLVTPDQIHAAFQFLDMDKKNRVTPENLRSRLGIFYDQLGMKDIKLLLNDQNELTEDYLTTLLLTNEVKNFDPVAEAFKAYDPDETGFVSRDMLRYVFERLGFGSLTEEDLNVLVACADADGDGRIGLNDFRSLLLPTQT